MQPTLHHRQPGHFQPWYAAFASLIPALNPSLMFVRLRGGAVSEYQIVPVKARAYLNRQSQLGVELRL